MGIKDSRNELIMELQEKVQYLEFINGELYECLGPANDDILQMAQDSYTKTFGQPIPAAYRRD